MEVDGQPPGGGAPHAAAAAAAPAEATAQTGQPLYSIGTVGRMLGVPAATLRTWQDRYGVVVPTRSAGGHRLYSRDQVEQLRFLTAQVADGLAPADAHRLLRERLTRPATGATGPDRAAGPGRAAGPATDPGRATDPPLVLLAERDPYAAELTGHVLRAEGYEVALTRSAGETLRRAAAGPDLFVVDLMLSAGQGVELCRQLTALGLGPILAVCTLDLRDAALAAGAADFLGKPVEPRQLTAAVGDLLGDAGQRRREVAP